LVRAQRPLPDHADHGQPDRGFATDADGHDLNHLRGLRGHQGDPERDVESHGTHRVKAGCWRIFREFAAILEGRCCPGRVMGAFLFWVLGILSASAQDHPPLPPVRPPELSQPKSHEAPPAAPAPASSPPVPSVQLQAAAGACLEELKASQIEAEAASSPHVSPDACSIAEPVRITSIGLHGGGKLDLPAHPLLDCSFALAFAGYLRDLVAPLGEAMLGATVVTLDTGPGYYCRDVDRVSGAKVNPHGKGIAIDVSAVLLADRRRIAVGHEASPQEALFMQTMRRAGCGWFTTILGPGDPDHADHFHFDILRHGATDNYRICE
jgi:hypothetical protein